MIRTGDSVQQFSVPQRLKLAVLDEGSSRSDLAERREVKFALPDVDLGKLRSLLAGGCRRLIHNEQVSEVRSIYFDDSRLSACRANLDGLGLRRKLRLRWYDSLRPGRDFFLEVKWRRNRVTGKHRLQMQADRPLSEVSYRELGEAFVDAIPPRLLPDVLNYPDPIAIVSYKREHFSSACGDLRVTLDYDLEYFDQTGRGRIYTEFPHRLDRLVVLEGKAPVGRETELKQLFYPYTPRATRCSKYVQGCHLLGFIKLD